MFPSKRINKNVEFLTPEYVTSSGKRVFTDVINIRSHLIRVGPTPMICFLLRKGETKKETATLQRQRLE